MQNRYTIFVFALLLSGTAVQSQPYIDLVNIRYMKSPEMSFLIPSTTETVLTYVNVSTTLPLLFKNKDAIILSPYFETWKVELSGEKRNYYGLVFPISYLKKIDDKWSLLSTGIVRWNDSAIYKTMKMQVGGAVIASRKITPNLALKGGIYINGEFFGLFVVPLLGIDWQINSTDCLFGVLPASLTYQHEASRVVKYGVTVHTQTNSYHRQVRDFTRIDENQLGAYTDFYIAKKFVFNLEGGLSILRKIRTGKNMYSDDKYTPYDVNNNLYFKVALAYRLPLR